MFNLAAAKIAKLGVYKEGNNIRVRIPLPGITSSLTYGFKVNIDIIGKQNSFGAEKKSVLLELEWNSSTDVWERTIPLEEFSKLDSTNGEYLYQFVLTYYEQGDPEKNTQSILFLTIHLPV